MKKYFFIFLFIFTYPLLAAELSPIEKQISENARKQKSAEIVFLKKLINVNSGTTNISGVHRVGSILQNEFKKLGFKTRWINEPKSMHKAGMLVAEHVSSKGKPILLIGHLDTVFPSKEFK